MMMMMTTMVREGEDDDTDGHW
eukprot:COSAG01_NODE_8150_length_2902_cov_1.545130_3_plen_22_part_01